MATHQTLTSAEFNSSLEGGLVNLSGNFIGKTLDLQVNGTTKTIQLDTLQGRTIDGVKEELQNLINKSFGALVNVTESGGKLTLAGVHSTTNISVRNTADELGFSFGMSNRVDLNDSVSKFFGTAEDQTLTFSINNTKVTINSNDSMSRAMSVINSSGAGVTLTFDATTERFVFTSQVTGDGDNIRLRDIEGGFLGNLVGAAGNNSITSVNTNNITLYGGKITGGIDLTAPLAEGTYTMSMTIGGVQKNIAIEIDDEQHQKFLEAEIEGPDELAKVQREFLQKALNAAKTEAFGATNTNASKVSFTVGADGAVSVITTDRNLAFSLEAGGAGSDLFDELGFDPLVADNTVEGATKLSDIIGPISGTDVLSITLGGGPAKAIALNDLEDMTVAQFMDRINSDFDGDIITLQNGKLVISGGNQDLSITNAGGNAVMQKLFGDELFDSGTFKSAGVDTARQTNVAGKNAVVTINNKQFVQNSNTFTYNGVQFDINAEDVKNITITVASDPNNVVDKLKNFIAEYNAMLDYLDTLVKEPRVAGFHPLNDDQRAEMSESEIRQWETEAKKGLLFNDPTLRGIMQDLRTVIYEPGGAAGIRLFDVGITTESFLSGSFRGNGRLEMNEAGERKLREMLETNPDAVRELFTSTGGIADRITKVIEDATRTSSGTEGQFARGSLVRMAGTTVVTADNTSVLGRQIENIDRAIASLKTRLETEYNRHWKMFARLETAISRMNTQSSWLMEFGGN
jgi:flagellar hook-associated protein 2